MAALLTSVMDKTDKLSIFINECKKMGLNILAPHINTSVCKFDVSGENIIYGLAGVKNVGQGAIEAIVSNRTKEGEFKSLFDLCKRVDLKAVNKRVLENLILGGAFDGLGEHRAQLLSSVEQAVEFGNQIQREKGRGQIQLFGIDEEESLPPSLTNVEPFSYDKKLSFEKNALGFYLSGHPLKPIENKLKKLITATSATLPRIKDRKRSVTIGGLLTQLRKTVTKKGDQMAYFTLEDVDGVVDVIVFPRTFKELSQLLLEDKVVMVQGNVKVEELDKDESSDEIKDKEAKVTFFAEKIWNFEPEAEEKKNSEKLKKSSEHQGIHIKVFLDMTGRKDLEVIKEFLYSQISELPVYLHLESGREKRLLALEKMHWASPKGIELQLENLLAEKCMVWIEN